jgi:hypothetical protein
MQLPRISELKSGQYNGSILLLTLLGAFSVLWDWPTWVHVFLVLLSIVWVVSQPARRKIDFTGLCIAPLLIGLFVAVAYSQIHQTSWKPGYGLDDLVDIKAWLKLAEFNPNYKEQFYTALSTLFAIIIALALVKGMDGIDQLKKSIAKEAHEVWSIQSYYVEFLESHNLSPSSLAAKDELKRLLVDYIHNVCDDSDSRKQGKKSNGDILRKCQAAMLRLDPADSNDRVAQMEIMKLLKEIGVARSERIRPYDRLISGYLLVALWMMSVALLLPFLAEPLCVAPKGSVAGFLAAPLAGPDAMGAAPIEAGRCTPPEVLSDKRFSQYFMIFMLASFFSFLLIMLHDVNDPEYGFWKVDNGPFEELKSQVPNRILAPAGSPGA